MRATIPLPQAPGRSARQHRSANASRVAAACLASLALHACLLLIPVLPRPAASRPAELSVELQLEALLEEAGPSRAAPPAPRPLEPRAEDEPPAAAPEIEPPAAPPAEPLPPPAPTLRSEAASAAPAEARQALPAAAPPAAQAAGPGASGPSLAARGPADPAALLAARIAAAVEEAKAYPEAARRRGTEGTVRLAFRVGPGGELLSSRVAASSGSTLLDRAALALLASVFPLANPAGRELALELSVRYSLKGK